MSACGKGCSRRRFIAGAGMAAAGSALGTVPKVDLHAPFAREALHWHAVGPKTIECELCPVHCETEPGERGECGVRENRDGKYVTLVYGRPVSMNNDPIEKKPLFHVYPGSRSFSIATVGCNIHCTFCQNWDISQKRPEEIPTRYVAPETIAQLARQHRCRTVAYTYSEPTIFFEYMLDCAKAVKDAGVGNVVVSNGYIEATPLKQLAPYLTAMKVDLKSFSQAFYSKHCEGELEPVLNTLRLLIELGVWLEIVVLVIPTLNDDMDEIKRMAAWIARELGPDVPLFFTRFHPAYKIRHLPRTPTKTIQLAGATARAEGLNFVYAGNMPGTRGENTYCPACKTPLVERYGHVVRSQQMESNACPKCERTIPGVW